MNFFSLFALFTQTRQILMELQNDPGVCSCSAFLPPTMTLKFQRVLIFKVKTVSKSVAFFFFFSNEFKYILCLIAKCVFLQTPLTI